MSIEPIVMAELKKWLPPTLEITSKVHKLQAKIIPDCLFWCIFSIILKLPLHFNIISMPIYSVTASKSTWSQRICSQYCNKFSASDGARTYFFCAKKWKYAQMAQWRSLAWTLSLNFAWLNPVMGARNQILCLPSIQSDSHSALNIWTPELFFFFFFTIFILKFEWSFWPLDDVSKGYLELCLLKQSLYLECYHIYPRHSDRQVWAKIW